MGRISDKELYPEVPSNSISVLDFLIGTQNATGLTTTYSIGDIIAAGEELSTIKVDLTNASSYQDNALIGKTFVYGWGQGQELLTGGVIQNYNNSTGTVTFVSLFTPFTGTLILKYA